MPLARPDLSKLLSSANASALLERVATLAGELPITDTVPLGSGQPSHPEDAAERAWLERDGFGRLIGAEAELLAPMRSTIDKLLAEGLPAVFLYLTDAVWMLGERLRPRISELLGRPYGLAADAWAWRIDPGQSGWPPHRGWRERLDRRAPELVNVWVALSDVRADQSCMHAVPLDRDPDYPGQLDRVASFRAPHEEVVALPIEAGTALFWNANVLHWGGPCSVRADGPRVSCSFSLVRDDALDRVGLPPVRLDVLDRRARLDLVAAQIATYGERKPDVSAEVLEWARATVVLREISRDRQRKEG
jgi:hypothetical protein